MNRLLLRRVAFVGDDVPSVAVDFASGLTVVHGPSDTGKTLIVEAIDFMLGAKEMRQVREMQGYSHLLLELELPDRSTATMSRPLTGGRFSVYYNSNFAAVPASRPDQSLLPSHSSRSNTQSLSGFLLEQIGVSGRQLRTNQYGNKGSLTFRHLARLCVVDETDIIAAGSPVLTPNNYVARPMELSAFRFVLQGVDDSDLPDGLDPLATRKKVARGRAEVVEQVAGDLRGSVDSSEGEVGLLERLVGVNAEIDERTSSIESVVEERTRLAMERSDVSEAIAKERTRLRDVQDLVRRFGLLSEQYDSDLARLEMVREAGTLLGFFQPGVCVFCGASPEHQEPNGHIREETTRLGEAVEAEQTKTRHLRDDLMVAVRDLRDQEAVVLGSLTNLSETLTLTEDVVRQLDSTLRPEKTRLAALLDTRSELERKIGVFKQLSELEHLRLAVSDVDSVAQRVEEIRLDDGALAELSRLIRARLVAWGLPDSSVSFDEGSLDLVVDGRPRASRGKGMRAILHAAFNLSLAEYCYQRDMAHPGFIILDSPLVTYREPDSGPSEQDVVDEAVSMTVADSFFRDLVRFPLQVIVVDNTPPPLDLSRDVAVLQFTANSSHGRYGLFRPVVPERDMP